MIELCNLPLPLLIKALIKWVQGYMFGQGFEEEEYYFSTGLWIALGVTLSAYGLPFFDGACDNPLYKVNLRINTGVRV